MNPVTLHLKEKTMKQCSLSPFFSLTITRFIAIFAMVMLFAVSSWGDTEPNNGCTEQELISELHGISTATSHTESGTTYDSHVADYYYFTPGITGNLHLHFTTTGGSIRLFVSTSTCGSDEIGSGQTNYEGDFSVSSTQTVFIRVQRNQIRSYNLAMTFTPDAVVPSLSIASASTTEGDSGTKNLTFTITQSAVSTTDTTVLFSTSNGTATAGSDYTAQTNQTVTISAGSTTATRNVVISGDTVYENNETFTVTLSSPSGATLGTASAIGTIINDDINYVVGSDDLCYNTPLQSGMCDMFGMMSFTCTTTLPLENISGEPLNDVNTYVDLTGLSFSMFSNCGVDGSSGNCNSQSDISIGSIVSMMDQGVVFDIPNLAIDDASHSFFTYSTFKFNLFASEILYATYNKAGIYYTAKLEPCVTPPPPPPDETGPGVTPPVIDPICDGFADMFQTRGACPSGGTISFNNGGQLLDGSSNIILQNSDNTLNTCAVNIPDWVTTQFETCGAEGDCDASLNPAASLSIDYNNPPAIASVSATPSSASEDVTLDGTTNLSAYAYDAITTSWHTNTTTNFSITNQLQINSLKMTQRNTFNFTGSSPYLLEIGTLGVENNGADNTIHTDTNAKNIKIGSFNLASGTTLSLEAAQTIKMNSFTVGRGSTVTLKAPYINMNTFESSNSGSGNSLITIYADYIDLGTLTLEQTVTLKIYPYTPGARILFRTNQLNESSSSTIWISSGEYFVNPGGLSIPGTSDVSALRAIDADQTIHFYINNSLSLGNNPGINAIGNKGNYDLSLPAANFILFINGSLTTGGGGTTINATIYTEGDVTLGNPTYVKGAVSAATSINVGQGQFTYDQSFENSGWGDCESTIPEEPPFDEQCGLFPSVLTSYEHLTMMKNNVIQSCYISYPDGEFTQGHTNPPVCYEDTAQNTLCADTDNNTANGNCNYTPPPTERYAHPFIDSTITTSSTTSYNPAALTDYEYGHINFNANGQSIHFNPSNTYSGGSTRKVMVLGDITISANNQILTFEAGDYYFNSLNFQKNGVIIQPKGDVRFFIKNNFNYAGNGANVNDTTASLFVYVGGNVHISSTGGGNGWLGMFIYAEGDVSIASNSNTGFYGGITAEGEINVSGNNFWFEYNKEGAENLGFGDCGVSVQFSHSQYRFSEPAIDGSVNYLLYPPQTPSPTQVKIVLSAPSDVNVSVTYVITQGTGMFGALADDDYFIITDMTGPTICTSTTCTYTVTFQPGETEKVITVGIQRDDLIELDETFHAELINPTPTDEIFLGSIVNAELIINGQDETDVPLCFADDFNSALDSKWRTLFSSGGFNPAIFDNRLRLTDRMNNLATAVTKDYEFIAQHNMIIVEFEQYAYGGCQSGQTSTTGGGLGGDGADGIVMVLYDSDVGASPEPGAYGGSMGYAQRHSRQGFEGGWLGLGIDEYGNFINPTEGRSGGLGFIPNNVTIRGSSDDLNGGNRYSGYRYLGSNTSLPHDVATKSRTVGAYPGDKYRLKIDARNPSALYVSLEQDAGSGYQTIIPTFDAKAVGNNQAPSPDYVRLAFTSGTGGGCNNHEIDELSVYGVCRPYAPTANGTYRVTELTEASATTWQEKWDNNDLTTRVAPIVNKRYCVVAGDETTTPISQLTLDKTVNIELWTGGSYNSIIESNTTLLHTNGWHCFDFNRSSAEQNVTFAIRDSYDPSILSLSDPFAIRPKDFVISTPGFDITKLPAGSIPIEVNATSSTSNSGVTGYGNNFPDPAVVDRNATYRIDLTTANDPACNVNDSGAIDTSFINGTDTPTMTYNNVGDLNVTYFDSNWTAIDQNLLFPDCQMNSTATNGLGVVKISGSIIKSLNGCNIFGSQMMTFVPDDFSIINVVINDASNDNNFTYLSNVAQEMGAEINVSVDAISNTGAVLTNYTALCFAKNGNLFITHSGDPHGVNPPNWLIAYDATNDRNYTNQAPISPNKFDFNESAFNNGSAALSVKINFDRNVSTPINPFRFNINDINFSDASGVDGNLTVDENLTYYYSRIHAPRYRFQGSEGNATLYYEVYCDNDGNRTLLQQITPNEILSVDSVNWYRNNLHDTNQREGNVSGLQPRNLIYFNQNQFANMGATSRGSFTINAAARFPYKTTVNINASNWLIYNRFDPAATMNRFDIEFSSSGVRGGEGKAGRTDQDAITNTNRRILW
ncbi:MAG: hypothetical protein JXK05_09430 [Campylobacterales bacterium]|nr:hypothetical protein [Campylobacterales bacterium]